MIGWLWYYLGYNQENIKTDKLVISPSLTPNSLAPLPYNKFSLLN